MVSLTADTRRQAFRLLPHSARSRIFSTSSRERHLLDKVAADAEIASSSGCRKTAYVGMG